VDSRAFDPDRALRAAFAQPRIIAERFGVIALVGGFRLTLDDSASLLWARYRLQLRSTHQIVAYFPKTIVYEQPFAGLVRLEPTGSIERLPAEITDDESVTQFRPSIYAHQPSPGLLFWDFAPMSNGPLRGSDQLFLTLRGASQPAPELESRLMLAVVAAGSEEELYFELPPSVHRVE
jgi:hypothetical protein